MPILFNKTQWSLLPTLLAPRKKFECRADCDSATMALAESKRMRLKTITRNNDYLRFGCAGCSQFKLRFAVVDRGETIGPGIQNQIDSRQNSERKVKS